MRKERTTLAVVITTALVFCAGALAATPRYSSPVNTKLTQAMVSYTGRADATVRCFHVADGADGGTWIDTAEVQLEPRICARIRVWSIWTPSAVEVFAHEGGHIVKGMSEGDAECYAKANIRRAARLLGFGPHKADVIKAQALFDAC